MVSQPRYASRISSEYIRKKLPRSSRKVDAAFWFFTFWSSRGSTGSVFSRSISAYSACSTSSGVCPSAATPRSSNRPSNLKPACPPDAWVATPWSSTRAR